MQKLTLDLDVLKVDSFDAGSADAVRGTVAANESTTYTLIGTTSTIIVTRNV